MLANENSAIYAEKRVENRNLLGRRRGALGLEAVALGNWALEGEAET